ncbi:hypothetical protein BCR42DRAFT_142262 [Absidia repens]|uniref:protein-histidine N-methyltransferase n=1 Tax=Absidia repens TaxID=90262 RepID=A0A1X2I408_9FUNG|nr:hypothetical protein BCR42DRAFT_142262 [Absidia repens]
MAFKFNFTVDELDLDEADNQPQSLETSLNDLSLTEADLNKVPCQSYDVSNSPLPRVIQADILNIPNVDVPIFKRTLADVKFQMAEQDTLLDSTEQQQITGEDGQNVLDMLDLTGNSDLVRGVYEGGFKTWECSIDLVQWLSSLPDEAIQGKRILEIGCGSALPSLYLLARHEENIVDVQDYNDQVIRLITLPNILLNTVLSPQEPTAALANGDQIDVSSDDDDNIGNDPTEEKNGNDDDDDDDDDEEEKDQVMEDPVTCDAEAELPSDKLPKMLQQVQQRTEAFVGDWEGLPTQLTKKYDMLITSETIYAEHSLPDLIRVFQKALVKPNGIG